MTRAELVEYLMVQPREKRTPAALRMDIANWAEPLNWLQEAGIVELVRPAGVLFYRVVDPWW